MIPIIPIRWRKLLRPGEARGESPANDDLRQDADDGGAAQQARNHEGVRLNASDQEDENGVAHQQVLPENTWELTLVEDSSIAEESEWITETINQPFDLTKDHTLRASLLQLKQDEYLLVVVMHHIAADGWSMPILVNELLEIYKALEKGQAHQFPPLAIQYADFARWQRNHLQGEVLKEKLSYWTDQLKDLDPLNLSTDFPRPAIQSTIGKSLDLHLDSELIQQAKKLSQKE